MNTQPVPLKPRRGAGGLAWTGAVLFAGSLSYFLFTYAVTFGEITTGAVAPAAIAADLALFTIFALHHSVFARERVRAWMGRVVSPRKERSVYVWVASLMLIAVCALWQPVAGVWLTLRSAAIIDIWDLAGVRQASSGPEGPLEFKTDGPYGWVRHPIYLGWLLLVFPMATMTMTRLVFALISSAYLVVAIPLEERSLLRASGGSYGAYMRSVRWKLIPGLF